MSGVLSCAGAALCAGALALGTVVATVGPVGPSPAGATALDVFVRVQLTFETVSGNNFTANDTVRIRVYDNPADWPGNAGNTQLDQSGIQTDGSGNFSVNVANQYQFHLHAGQLVVATDNAASFDHSYVVTNLTVKGTDAANGIVYGTADAGSEVQVNVSDGQQNCLKTVTADGNGDWSVDFTVQDASSDPSNCTFPTPFDVPENIGGSPQGLFGDARQVDVNYDDTEVHWQPPQVAVSTRRPTRPGRGCELRVRISGHGDDRRPEHGAEPRPLRQRHGHHDVVGRNALVAVPVPWSA